MLSFGLELASNAKISRTSNTSNASGPTFPQAPEDNAVWLLTEIIEDKEPGLYVYLAEKGDWYPQLDDSRAYDISINVNKRYMQNDTLTTFLVPRVVKVPINFKGSAAVAQVPATGAVVFQIMVESGDPAVRTQIGSISFEAGARIGTITSFVPDSGYVLVPNDLLTVESGATVDPTLNKISITLASSLVV